jgi:hypothetical protein
MGHSAANVFRPLLARSVLVLIQRLHLEASVSSRSVKLRSQPAEFPHAWIPKVYVSRVGNSSQDFTKTFQECKRRSNGRLASSGKSDTFVGGWCPRSPSRSRSRPNYPNASTCVVESVQELCGDVPARTRHRQFCSSDHSDSQRSPSGSRRRPAPVSKPICAGAFLPGFATARQIRIRPATESKNAPGYG